MSDFLSRLGSRHIAEPVVRPRAASRFEQTPAQIAEPSSTTLEEKTVAETWMRSVVGTPLNRVDTTPPVATQSSRDFAPRATDGLLDDVAIPQPHIPLEPRAQHTSHHTDLGAEAHRVPDRVSEVRATTEPRRALESVVPRTPAPPTTSQSPITTRVAERAQSTSDRTLGAAERTSTPDVVRVHIGRVEVRAITPPAERARSRATKASDADGPLTLDRYLSGKGRP